MHQVTRLGTVIGDAATSLSAVLTSREMEGRAARWEGWLFRYDFFFGDAQSFSKVVVQVVRRHVCPHGGMVENVAYHEGVTCGGFRRCLCFVRGLRCRFENGL